MVSEKTKKIIAELADTADIKLNGNRPYDIKIKSNKFYERLLNAGTVGAGESYMAGEWDCDAIDKMICHIIKADLGHYVNKNRKYIAYILGAKLMNRGRKSKAFEIGRKHYDIGNDLYKAMLDKRMVYSCGYWKKAKNLDEAQKAKLDLICKKLMLKKGMRILDIGSGWGGLGIYAAQKYGVSSVLLTVSKEQKKLTGELIKGLPIKVRLQDYRDINEKFDRVISIGMFEHVGPKNYREYMKVVRRCLNDDGLSLLHTITGLKSGYGADPWIDKYIFPNGAIPSIKQIVESTEGLFVIEDIHNFGADYDKTLMQWYKNFEAAWPKLKKNYSETFHRMWRLYLLSCAAGFRMRTLSLIQTVLSPKGVPGGYVSIR